MPETADTFMQNMRELEVQLTEAQAMLNDVLGEMKAGITPLQASILHGLRKGEATVKQIELDHGTTNASYNVNLLAKRGLLSKRTNPMERRQVLCELTFDGYHLLERMAMLFNQRWGDVISVQPSAQVPLPPAKHSLFRPAETEIVPSRTAAMRTARPR